MEESMGASGRGPGLYEFLIEAELQHYYSGLKNDLKVNTVAQIKYVEDDDLMQIGMTKPESRRLKKFFHRYYPQTYLRRIKQMILPRKDDNVRSFAIPDSFPEKHSVKVPSKHIIPTDNIFVNKELGIGEFGVVQQGVWTNEDGERIQVAIKKLSKERMQNNPMEFLKEAAIMHTVDHEHIVRLYGVVLETNALMLVTELAPLRSLLECLKEPALRPSFPILSLCDFAFQTCDGMQYLESKRLIHRDLAARNILVFSKNKIKISDFGLSRALGVGKDYYQTNFNVNLKLPIAWCAPECINYLRFTSASDVWAYGVTLWEMFSYGFQPWAALTGQQILEAIDEPNFQRLEQPEACPREYYLLMTKCWQHDPNKRPKFSEIAILLPECKPEQVQTVQDYPQANGSPKPKYDQLQYKVGDVITVLDKKPLSDSVNIWKGILNNGKTGLFNPAHTVTYLGTNIPSMKLSFSRSDSKSGVYSSKRRLRPEMISSPQGDFRHTGHVGLDGAFFGDISCLGEKYHLLPKQIVAPYKPQEDGESSSSSLIRAASDVSDKAPLLKKAGEVVKNGIHEETWSNMNNDKVGEDKSWAKNFQDHEYHEISDDEDLPVESPRFERCLDFGPSLMDEVFKALGTKTDECDEVKDEANNVKNEIKEITSKTKDKKKQSTVKPISAMDQKTLDSAIAMANEMASRSMLELDHCSEFDMALDSPNTPSSPTKHKFSFRLPTSRSSPKLERRNFAEEAACIPDIQETLSEEAKEAYTTLVERNSVEEETNPLRMLRSGVPVRPKVRGNKHVVSGRGLVNDSAGHTSLRLSDHRLSDNRPSTYSTQTNNGSCGPPPVSPKPTMQQQPLSPKLTLESGNVSRAEENLRQSLNENGHHRSIESSTSAAEFHTNPIPLPPRDRTKPMQQHKPRQRKHPLLIPGGTGKSLVKTSVSMPDVSPEQTNGKHDLSETASVSSEIISPLSSPVSLATSSTPTSEMTLEEDGENTKPQSHSLNPPAKPPRSQIVDDSFDNQIQADMDSLDDIPEEDAPIPPNNHHVSCEDLLDFACDRPNTKRTQGRARGTDSDEVRIMQKVLASEIPVRRKLEASPEECVDVLNETDWDVHKAIKYIKLQTLLQTQMVSISNCKQTLINCNWDVQKAYSYLLATYGVTEDSTEV